MAEVRTDSWDEFTAAVSAAVADGRPVVVLTGDDAGGSAFAARVGVLEEDG